MSGRRCVAVMCILSVLACHGDRGTAVPIPVEPSTPSFARSQDTHSRGNQVWSDMVVVNGTSVNAGIRGDGRNRQGQLTGTPNEYQGDFCGARDLIYDQRGEDGNLDSDTDVFYDAATMSASCGSARQLAFYLGDASTISTSPTWVGPHVVISGIWTLAPGQSRLQPFVLGMQLVTCQLRFDATYAGADNIRVSRLADVSVTDAAGHMVVARQWRAESQGSHRAACFLPPSGPGSGWTDTGKRYFLPFSVLVTQVPYPSATYPL